MNQKQLVEAARQLLSLIDDPHPGLVTWNVACGKAAAKIKEAFYEESSDGLTSIETTVDGRVKLSVGIDGEPPAVRITLKPEQAIEIAEGLLKHARPLRTK